MCVVSTSNANKRMTTDQLKRRPLYRGFGLAVWTGKKANSPARLASRHDTPIERLNTIELTQRTDNNTKMSYNNNS